MQVVCINSSNRPARIPENKWIKEGETYTVVFAVKLNVQKNKIGYRLKEIELDESCFPYQYFDSERFGLPVGTPELAERNLELV